MQLPYILRPRSAGCSSWFFTRSKVRFDENLVFFFKSLPLEEWTETFGPERLTGALLDRLTHHVSILEMNGESYRLA